MKEKELSVRESLDLATYKQAADKIRQILSAIRNNQSASAKRWVWELLQNAKDIPNRFGKVSIEIELISEKELRFKHNGNPFVIDNITGLVRQVSSKDSLNSDEEQTGKFGTGFICTHLLSDIIDVSGILNYFGKDRQFALSLDRSGRSSEELIPRIKETEDILLNIEKKFPVINDYEKNRKENDFDTIFTYHLSTNEKYDSAVAGINDLVNTLPITLIIQAKKIKQVHVIDHVHHTDVLYTCNSSNIDDNVTFSEIKINEDIKQFLSYANSEVALCIGVCKDDNGYNLIKRDPQQPVLYRDFPLIGSDKFYFPFTLNGFRFYPSEKRDSILLNGEDNEDAKDNRAILESAVDAVIEFNNWLIAHNSHNRYLLANSRIPRPSEDYDENTALPWIKNLQKKWRAQLIDQMLVETVSDIKTLKELSLPIFSNTKEENESFYQIVAENYIGRGVLPKHEALQGWIETIKPEYESWNTKLKYEMDDFLSDLQDLKDIETLCDRVNKPKEEIIQWLNKVYRFLIDHKLVTIFENYAIVPNENGNFTLLQNIVSDYSDRIPQVLKDIYDTVVEDDKETGNIFIDKDIDATIFGNNLITFGLKEIITKFNDSITDDDIAQTICYQILSLHPKSGKNSYLAYRKKIYDFCAEHRSMDEYREIDIENTDLWKETDNYWFENSCSDIKECKDVSTFASDYFNTEKTEEESLVWLNDFISFYRDNSYSDIVKEYDIFPNQELELKNLSNLHYDNHIPEEFKDLAKYASDSYNTDNLYRPILLHPAINGYEQHNPLDLSDVYQAVTDYFDNQPPHQDEIASQAISLLPKDDADVSLFNQLYITAETIFGDDIPQQKEVNYSAGFKWGFAQKYYIRKISQAIAESEDLNGLKQLSDKFSVMDDADLTKWVDDYIEFIHNFKSKRYWKYITDQEEGFGIWLNQCNEFCKFQDVQKDDSIDDDLKDIALNPLIDIEYRKSLFTNNSKLSHLLETQPLTYDAIGKEIDEKIENFDGDKQNKNFSEIIFAIRKLCDKYPLLAKSMMYFTTHKNSLIVGSLGNGEMMDNLGALIQQGDEKIKLMKIIAETHSVEEIKKMMTNPTISCPVYNPPSATVDQISVQNYYNKSVATISLADTIYGGLTTMQAQEALLDAKKAVQQILELQGYEFTQGLCPDEFGNIHGVKKDGTEYPLVVHSYKQQTRPFQLTAFDWEQLSRPNSMLWIVNYEGAKCVPFYKLVRNREIVKVSFNSSNFEYEDRCIALAQVLRYFKGLHFDFDSLKLDCTSMAEKFNNPEKPLREALDADSEDVLI